MTISDEGTIVTGRLTLDERELRKIPDHHSLMVLLKGELIAKWGIKEAEFLDMLQEQIDADYKAVGHMLQNDPRLRWVTRLPSYGPGVPCHGCGTTDPLWKLSCGHGYCDVCFIDRNLGCGYQDHQHD